MINELSFPSRAETVSREVERFRRLRPSDRWLAILDLVALGERFLASSPRRKEAEELRRLEELRWRKAYRELFRKHGV